MFQYFNIYLWTLIMLHKGRPKATPTPTNCLGFSLILFTASPQPLCRCLGNQSVLRDGAPRPCYYWRGCQVSVPQQLEAWFTQSLGKTQCYSEEDTSGQRGAELCLRLLLSHGGTRNPRPSVSLCTSRNSRPNFHAGGFPWPREVVIVLLPFLAASSHDQNKPLGCKMPRPPLCSGFRLSSLTLFTLCSLTLY